MLSKAMYKTADAAISYGFLYYENGIEKLSENITLYPGHGEETTLGYEIKNNPYFN